MFLIRTHFLQHPRKSMNHVNMTEHAIHFWRLRLRTDKSVDSYTSPAYVTVFTFTSNKVSGISRLSFLRTFYDPERLITAPGRSLMACPYQKLAAVMLHIL